MNTTSDVNLKFLKRRVNSIGSGIRRMLFIWPLSFALTIGLVTCVGLGAKVGAIVCGVLVAISLLALLIINVIVFIDASGIVGLCSERYFHKDRKFMELLASSRKLLIAVGIHPILCACGMVFSIVSMFMMLSKSKRFRRDFDKLSRHIKEGVHIIQAPQQ